MLVHLQLVNQENSSQRLVHVILVIHMKTLMGQKEDVFYQNAVTEPRHLLMELVIHAQIMNWSKQTSKHVKESNVCSTRKSKLMELVPDVKTISSAQVMGHHVLQPNAITFSSKSKQMVAVKPVHLFIWDQQKISTNALHQNAQTLKERKLFQLKQMDSLRVNNVPCTNFTIKVQLSVHYQTVLKTSGSSKMVIAKSVLKITLSDKMWTWRQRVSCNNAQSITKFSLMDSARNVQTITEVNRSNVLRRQVVSFHR